ncbi:Pao retrotransposon peptidase family protein, partial [Aphelenchoides avenae]
MFRTTFQRRATKKTSPPDRSGSPLRFNADGSRRSNPSDAKKLYNDAVKTGADFSVYNSNPFYQNSCVKLPIRPSECVPSGTDKYPAPPPLNFKGITDTPFAGDIRIYPNWRDAFIRLVHAPGRVMQDSERLLYLKQCLKGAPLDLVDRYPINDLGYQFATQQLEAHYFDEQKARYTLRQDLQGMRSPNAGYADLLRFHQELVHICGNFYQAGEDITDNDWCSDIVMAKLPYSVRHTLNTRKADQGDDSPWTISQVLEELQRALNVMKRTALYDGGQQQPYGSKSKNSRLHAIEGSSYERTGGTFVGAVTEGPKTRSCPFCGVKGVHWPTDCPTYPTVSSRYARAKELDFCFVCLQRDHWRMNAKACKATNNGLCTSCGKAFHHKALCSTFLEKRRAGGSRQQGRNQRPSNRNQSGAGSSQNPKNGRRPYRGQQGGGVPVAPGGTALHPTSYGPHQRQSQPGRAQIHAAAAAGIEEASAPDRTAAPSSKDSGYTGTPSTPQQPSGSPQVADS